MAEEKDTQKPDQTPNDGSRAPSGGVHPLVRQVACKVVKHRIKGYPSYWAININGLIWGDYGYAARGKANAEEAMRHIRPVLDALNTINHMENPTQGKA